MKKGGTASAIPPIFLCAVIGWGRGRAVVRPAPLPDQLNLPEIETPMTRGSLNTAAM